MEDPSRCAGRFAPWRTRRAACWDIRIIAATRYGTAAYWTAGSIARCPEWRARTVSAGAGVDGAVEFQAWRRGQAA